MTSEITPKKHTLRKHNHSRNDPYYWLQKSDNSTLIQNINQKTTDYFCDTDSLQQTLIQEIKDKTFEDDKSILTKYKKYYYFSEIKQNENYGKAYVKKTKGAKPYCYFNPEKLSKNKKQFTIGSPIISYDESYLLYSVDYTGDRKYTLYLKKLFSHKSEKLFQYQISNDYLFHLNNHSFYYLKLNHKIRPYQLYLYDFLTKKNTMIYEETNEEYSLSLSLSTDEQVIFLYSSAYEHDNVYQIDDTDLLELLIQKRKNEYQIDHYQNKFYLLTNENQKINFELYESENLYQWKCISKHSLSTYIESFFIWYDSIFLSIREKGFPRLLQMNLQNYKTNEIKFPLQFYSYGFISNLNPSYHKLKISYSSFSQSRIIYEYNLKTNQLHIIENKKLKNHDPKNYKEGYLKIGKLIVTYIYRKDKIKLDGTQSHPCYLYGYGSYGVIDDPTFDKYTMSLVDRGYLYCIANLRGSKFYGPKWYHEGKYLKKKNTFKDFQTIAQYLIHQNYTSPDKLVVEGGSAGGLLIGSCINMNPSLYHVAVLRVPYVDCLTTLLNPDLPLTIGEYNEWGNPGKYKTYYDYILSYSPYDNIDLKKQYPHIYIDTGLHDSQVIFHEPLKYYAKLTHNQHFQQNTRTLLFNIRTQSGHSGSSKRYQQIIDETQVLTFILKQNK